MRYDKTLAEQIGKRVERMRKSQGLSLRAFAAKVGLGYDTIYRIERGGNFPTILSALMLADYFGMTLDELVKGDGCLNQSAL